MLLGLTQVGVYQHLPGYGRLQFHIPRMVGCIIGMKQPYLGLRQFYNMQARYRRDYSGEFVITRTRLANGRGQQIREWIPNSVENQHISGRAAVIGSAVDQERFDYTRLQRHRGGLLGKKRLQTYASGTIWSEMPVDFYVTIDRPRIKLINAAEYHKHSVVYTTPGLCIAYPGDFFLVPMSPQLSEIALAVYLAAFDQHEEVFLLGYNNETPVQDSGWVAHVNSIFEAYAETRFVLVGASVNMPDAWRNNRNVDTMKYRDFVIYCDI